MALIFPRLARNFIKNGYYPTDSETMSRIVQAISFNGKKCRIIDPCCGEGTALAEVKNSLTIDNQQVIAYGVEYDKERAWHSKQMVDHCVHADLRDCSISPRQFGLLFLNPPYGDAVADKAQVSDQKSARLRLEKEFYRRTNGLLQFGGIGIIIVPYYVLDKELSTWISTHFSEVNVFMAPEQQFKQCVIFGIKKKITPHGQSSDEYKETRANLIAVGNGDVVADPIPEFWDNRVSSSGDGLYTVPEAHKDDIKFESVRLDGLQLADTLPQYPGLWRQYDQLFNFTRTLSHKRPLCDVSNWHLALMLAAGQVSGVVKSTDGRTFVVRGNTFKDKKVTVNQEDPKKGDISTTHTDIFVPKIRGLDMTPGSSTYGEVFVIQ